MCDSMTPYFAQTAPGTLPAYLSGSPHHHHPPHHSHIHLHMHHDNENGNGIGHHHHVTHQHHPNHQPSPSQHPGHGPMGSSHSPGPGHSIPHPAHHPTATTMMMIDHHAAIAAQNPYAATAVAIHHNGDLTSAVAAVAQHSQQPHSPHRAMLLSHESNAQRTNGLSSISASNGTTGQAILGYPPTHSPPPHNANSLHYGNHHHQGQQPPYPRFPPYDRLVEQQQHSQLNKHPDTPTGTVPSNSATGAAASQSDTSPFFSANSNNNNNTSSSGSSSRGQIPNSQSATNDSLGANQQTPYDCSGRGSISPPSLDGSNGGFGSCKMLPNDGSMTPLGPNSPSPSSIHQHHQQMYVSHDHVGSPGQSSQINSPLYPWMRSQFGKFKI